MRPFTFSLFASVAFVFVTPGCSGGANDDASDDAGQSGTGGGGSGAAGNGVGGSNSAGSSSGTSGAGGMTAGSSGATAGSSGSGGSGGSDLPFLCKPEDLVIVPFDCPDGYVATTMIPECVHKAQCDWAHICRGGDCPHCQASIDELGPDDIIGCLKAEYASDGAMACLQGEIANAYPECPH